MDAAKRETLRVRLEARRQSLQRKLARVEGQIVQVEQQMMATRMRIAALTEGQRKAA
jgi:predicted amino acid-binding ACT domain protein